MEAADGVVQDALEGVRANAVAWAAERVVAGVLPPGAEGWALLYGGELPAGGDVWFHTMLGYDLLVGYEMSANQLRFLSRHGAVFLDIGIDAVRFARRTLFRVRTNSRVISNALQHFHMSAQLLAADTGFLRAMLGGGDTGSAEDLLFVGQVEIDSSLIVNGRIQRIGPHLPRLAELAGQHRRMLVHPHPLATRNDDVTVVLEALPQSTFGEGQVYAALVDARTRTIATLSSSVANEAELLGKKAVRLLEPDGSSEALGLNVVFPYMRVDSGIAQVGFWNAVLGRGRQRWPIPSGHGPDEATLRSALGVFATTPSMIRPVPFVSVESAVSLADPTNADLCRLGWSGVEAAGRWTDGPVAMLAFDAAAASTGLVLSLVAFIGPVPRTLRIRLVLAVANTAVLEKEVLLDSEAAREVHLPYRAPPGRITLKLMLDAPCSPAELGISSDTRQLGVQLGELRLIG